MFRYRRTGRVGFPGHSIRRTRDSDTWITDYFYYEIMYVVEEEDVNAAEFTWEYQDDIPDSSCNTSFPLEKKQ